MAIGDNRRVSSRLLGLGERSRSSPCKPVSRPSQGQNSASSIRTIWRGRGVIFFWPADFTFVCPTELVEFNRALREFAPLRRVCSV